MKISGSYTIDAPRDQVWAALNDIEVLARVVPGCERLDQTGENEFVGQVKIGVQSIKGTYSGKIRLEDIQPPAHYKLVANGKSANGVVDGAGTVDLEEQDGKTLLRYGGEAQIGGVLASVGQRLIEGASRQLINQSLKALAEQVAIRSGKSPAPATPATVTPATVTPATVTTSQPAAASPTAPPQPPAGVIAEAAAAAPTGGAPAPATVNGTAPETERAAEHAPAVTLTANPERRSVVVPPDEQLKPESVFIGMVQDFIAERPWTPWVIVAFLLGYVFGISRRK